MKKLKFLVLTITLILLSCERDDICAETTSTTPRLIIEFYDNLDNDELKSVPRLTVYGEGLLTEPPETNLDETIVFNSNVNSIELPLLIGEEGESTTVRYLLEKDTNLRLDDDTNTSSNVDILEITYSSEYIYVSRACGYKSIFNGINITRENDGDTWISSVEEIEIVVENENTTHAYIYH